MTFPEELEVDGGSDEERSEMEIQMANGECYTLFCYLGYSFDGQVALICPDCEKYCAFSSVEKLEEHIRLEHGNSGRMALGQPASKEEVGDVI